MSVERAPLTPLQQVHREADLGDLDITMQMMFQGSSAVIIGGVLAATGPTTPSFDLLETLTGWPHVYGGLHLLVGALVVFSAIRPRRPRLGTVSLLLMASGYAGVALALWFTWLDWHANGPVGPEPLAVAVPVCFLLAVQCAYLAGLIFLRRRRGARPVLGR